MKNKRKKGKIKWIVSLLFLFVLSAESRAVFGNAQNVNVSKVRSGVVRIFVEGPGCIGLGTGFGVGKAGEDADTFVTNWHVVTGSGYFDYKDARIYLLLDDETYCEYKWIPAGKGAMPDETGEYAEDADGNLYRRTLTDISLGSVVECEVLYAKEQYPDVAVLHTKKPVKNVKTLPLKYVSQDYVGSRVYTLGYPASADEASLTGTEDTEIEKIKGSVDSVSMDDAIISKCTALERFGNTDCITHHAHISQGSSGGPLVMEDGSVIGINTYGYGENTMEYSASIYIDYAIKVLDELSLSYTLAGNHTNNSRNISFILAAAGAAALSVVLALVLKKRTAAAGSRSVQGQAPLPAASSPESAIIAAGQAPLAVTAFFLKGMKGAYAGRSIPLQDELRIGRDPRQCNFVYPAGTKGVSGMHCVIRMRNNGADITDLSSTYGTAVNGKKLEQNRPYILSAGDRIFLGSLNEEFQITKEEGFNGRRQ